MNPKLINPQLELIKKYLAFHNEDTATQIDTPAIITRVVRQKFLQNERNLFIKNEDLTKQQNITEELKDVNLTIFSEKKIANALETRIQNTETTILVANTIPTRNLAYNFAKNVPFLVCLSKDFEKFYDELYDISPKNKSKIEDYLQLSYEYISKREKVPSELHFIINNTTKNGIKMLGEITIIKTKTIDLTQTNIPPKTIYKNLLLEKNEIAELFQEKLVREYKLLKENVLEHTSIFSEGEKTTKYLLINSNKWFF